MKITEIKWFEGKKYKEKNSTEMLTVIKREGSNYLTLIDDYGLELCDYDLPTELIAKMEFEEIGTLNKSL